MPTTPHTDPADPSHLWSIVRASLKGRISDTWTLADSSNPQLRYFMQLGLHGSHMEAYFRPRDESGPGLAYVRLELGPSDLSAIASFTKEQPGALTPPGWKHTLLLVDEDNQVFDPAKHDPVDWKRPGAVQAQGSVVSPAGPDLFGRLGPWYPEALEGIYRFIAQATDWYHSRQRQPR